jgi:hypothetical protein
MAVGGRDLRIVLAAAVVVLWLLGVAMGIALCKAAGRGDQRGGYLDFTLYDPRRRVGRDGEIPAPFDQEGPSAA